ncbi:MAG: Gfo/Idh/MocA family oxidoreductase [Bacteroidota bacterium]|nr:Gfo/Idh/MocA family oxidoreductase [Bacteroidota bacterium]
MKEMNSSRRQFLRNAAVIAGGTIVAPTILSRCAKGANDRVLLAHIGVGSMGQGALKSWFMPLETVYSVATCDTFLDRRIGAAQYVNRTYKEKNIKAPECLPYLDFDEILQRKDIDAVNITTPDHWHVLAAIKAARAGKHVMLAKPLGLSYPDFKILEKELKANDVRFHYGTQQRAMSHMKLVVSMIKEGKIGEVDRVEVWAPGKNDVPSPQCNEVPVPGDFDYDRWTGPARLNPYCPDRVTNNSSWFQNDYSIGFLAGWGAHPLDIMIWAMKDKMDGEYTCEGTGTFWEPGGIYNNIYSWDLNYEYKSGIKLHFMSDDVVKSKDIWNYRKVKDTNTTTFFGSKGWISVGRGSAESNIPEIQQKFDEFPRESKSVYIKGDGYKMGQLYIDVVKGTVKETNPLDEAILSDCVSHMGDIAIRTGRKITWNPTVGEVVGDPEANKIFSRESRKPYIA